MHSIDSILNLTRDEYDILERSQVQNKYVWWIRTYFKQLCNSSAFRDSIAHRIEALKTKGRRFPHKSRSRILIFDNQHYLGIGDERNSVFQCIVQMMREARMRGLDYLYILCAEPSAWPYEKTTSGNLSEHISRAIRTIYNEPCQEENIYDLEPSSRLLKIKDYPYYLIDRLIEISPCQNDVIFGIGWGSFAFHELVRYLNPKRKVLVKFSMDIAPGSHLESNYDMTLESGLSSIECYRTMHADNYRVLRIPYEMGLVERQQNIQYTEQGSRDLEIILTKHHSDAIPLVLVAALDCQERINDEFHCLLTTLIKMEFHLLLIGVSKPNHTAIKRLQEVSQDSPGTLSILPVQDNIDNCFRKIVDSKLSILLMSPQHTGNARTIISAAVAGIPVFIKPPSDASHRISAESKYYSSSDILSRINNEMYKRQLDPSYMLFQSQVRENITLLTRDLKSYTIAMG